MPSRFLIDDIPLARITQFLLAQIDCDSEDEIVVAAKQLVGTDKPVQNTANALEFLNVLFSGLYLVGAIGAKFDASGRPEWASANSASAHARRFEVSTLVYVHPMLFRNLGIKPIGTTI